MSVYITEILSGINNLEYKSTYCNRLNYTYIVKFFLYYQCTQVEYLLVILKEKIKVLVEKLVLKFKVCTI